MIGKYNEYQFYVVTFLAQIIIFNEEHVIFWSLKSTSIYKHFSGLLWFGLPIVKFITIRAKKIWYFKWNDFSFLLKD